MSESESEEEAKEKTESCWVAALALVAVVTGTLLIVTGCIAVDSTSLRTADRLLRWDAGGGSSGTLSCHVLFWTVLLVGIAVVLGGCLGVVGALSRKRCLVAAYVLTICPMAFIVICLGWVFHERRSMMEPVIDVQVNELCNGTKTVRYGQSMNCRWASSYAQESACNLICQSRVSILSQLNGCSFLPELCGAFNYHQSVESWPGCAGTSALAMYSIELGQSGFVEGTLEECAKACDADLLCMSFAYAQGACVHNSGALSLHEAPAWSIVANRFSDAFASLTCYERDEPKVFASFRDYGFKVAYAMVGLGIVLVLSALAACILMYNVNVRSQHRPQGHQLAAMLCCPCWERGKHGRIKHLAEELDSES